MHMYIQGFVFVLVFFRQVGAHSFPAAESVGSYVSSLQHVLFASK